MIAQTTDGLDIHYEVHGSPDAAETLVFLNGLTQSTTSWSFMLPYFTARYRIILLDFIFQGRSGKSGNWRDFDQHARDVERVICLTAPRSLVMIGISYGSLVAQHYALLFPQRLKKLVLLSTFAHKIPQYEAIEQTWWRALEQGGFRQLLEVMLPDVLSKTYFAQPLMPIELMKEMRLGQNQNADAVLKLMRATKERQDFRSALEGIRTPTLIIHGELDSLLPVALAHEVHKHIRNSELLVVPGAGHTLNLEKTGLVSKKILEFLSQVE